MLWSELSEFRAAGKANPSQSNLFRYSGAPSRVISRGRAMTGKGRCSSSAQRRRSMAARQSVVQRSTRKKPLQISRWGAQAAMTSERKNVEWPS